MKRGREHQKEYNVEKKGRNVIFRIILTIRAVGKNINWGRGKADENFGEENQDFKKNWWLGIIYRVVQNFLRPCNF